MLNPLLRLLQPKQLAILEACLIGGVSGLAAVSLKNAVAWLGQSRLQMAVERPLWLILPVIGCLGGLASGWLIEQFAPEAAGSGIPQLKAALGGVSIRLNAQVAIVKFFSTLLSLGAGLSLGRQGPTVQIGAAIGSQLSVWVPTSPLHRRQLIASGAAAGLAAGFNAPIAGVLFVIEELLQDVSGLTLGTAILASFIGAVVSRALGNPGLMVGQPQPLTASTLPLFLVLGILAGGLGMLFNRGILLSLRLNRQISQALKVGLPWRMGAAGLGSGLIVACLPEVLRDGASLQEVWVTSELSWSMTLLLFITKFLLTLLACGSGAPGGLFAPSLILGAALGHLLSDAIQALQTAGLPLALGGVDADALMLTLALTGMGAFFSAVTRGPITAIVIVFEMTANFNLVLPLMIGSVTAYLVAETLYSGSIYKHLLVWNGIQIQTHPIESRLAGLTAADIMQQRVETLTSQMSLQEVVQAFSRSHHRGFPVVDQGKLVGIVTQSDLAAIQERSLSDSEPLNVLMTPHPITVQPTDPLSQVLYSLNQHKVSRLPVVEHRKLVGIITRADIIRAEADALTRTTGAVGPQPEPSYCIYQTRAPTIGKGRLLVPIANPETMDGLLAMAAAIARTHQYELECLQVILIPRHQAPAETAVSGTASRRLLRRVNHLGKAWQIPVHTQIRVGHDLAAVILETVKARHIDLVLMGWKGDTLTPGRVFGSAVDAVVRQASCQVLLVKLGLQPLRYDRWLIPTAGGPHCQQAMQLLPALIQLSPQPDIALCQVHPPDRPLPNAPALHQAREFLVDRLNCPVTLLPIAGETVAEAVIDLTAKNRCDVIVLGVSREGLLKQMIQGNIPATIARQCECTVLLVR